MYDMIEKMFNIVLEHALYDKVMMRVCMCVTWPCEYYVFNKL